MMREPLLTAPVDEIPVSLRQATALEIPFIAHSLIKSFRHSSSCGKKLAPGLVETQHLRLIKGVLSRPEAKTILATMVDDPNTFFGFILFEKAPHHVIHYLYVKEAFRGFGIGRLLVNATQCDLDETYFTHWTYDFANARPWDRYPGLTYNPYLLVEPYADPVSPEGKPRYVPVTARIPGARRASSGDRDQPGAVSFGRAVRTKR